MYSTSVGTKSANFRFEHFHSGHVSRVAVLTKNMWERIQTNSHFETASNSF